MLLQNKQVAIIGAGPVGLTMAKLLQQQGVAVNVYERDKNPQARVWGGTLDLHKNSGQLAMAKAGLLQKYYDLALPMGIKIADEHARILFTKPITAQNAHDNPEINRSELRKMLLNSLVAATVVWDSKFTGMEEHDGKWLIHFEDKPDAMADVVIGANGGMSKVRDYVTVAEIKATGSFIIQGDVPQPEQCLPEFYKLCNDHRLMAAHDGNMLVVNPRNGNLLSYGIIMKTPEEWADGGAPDFNDNDNIVKYLTQRFAGWNERYHELFDATAFFAGITTKVAPLDTHWKTDRPLPITLIGDAAHLMPPFAGMGVNTGLLDALRLSENLTDTKYQSIEDAIGAYEQQMFSYAFAAQAESHKNEMEMRDPKFSFRQLLGI
ncbi:FAD-dependent oxidoreductase [Mucilaginibacter terrae]|uniref:Flavin-dependent monooxygenase n=1 Tax=Mucilaginibacter terrae TaxID=1955052 RepID=A0ABU3GZH4_9SPHI|nr:NAD(P)/FAD-dependent oxidoreductase [Mucilaginibacter terrae]MDT3404841.1 2-polyprenyl-6-methoxyphenol hydroxylase-like FAD-dependent oxidoreductase [Mucilaginibacter terrae]